MAKEEQQIKNFVTCKFYGDKGLIDEISNVLADNGIDIHKTEESNGYVTKTGYRGTAQTIKYVKKDGGDT